MTEKRDDMDVDEKVPTCGSSGMFTSQICDLPKDDAKAMGTSLGIPRGR